MIGYRMGQLAAALVLFGSMLVAMLLATHARADGPNNPPPAPPAATAPAPPPADAPMWTGDYDDGDIYIVPIL